MQTTFLTSAFVEKSAPTVSSVVGMIDKEKTQHPFKNGFNPATAHSLKVEYISRS